MSQSKSNSRMWGEKEAYLNYWKFGYYSRHKLKHNSPSPGRRPRRDFESAPGRPYPSTEHEAGRDKIMTEK
jgi:hypothetical protein